MRPLLEPIALYLRRREANFTPLALPGLVQWCDISDITTLFQDTAAATPVTTNGQSIGRINDKSSAGTHVTQATATAKPTYMTGIQNGLPVASFDGGDYLDSTLTYLSFPLTIVGVARTSATVGTQRGLISLLHDTNFGTRVAFSNTNIVLARIQTPTNNTGNFATFAADTPAVFGARFASSQISGISNGAITTTAHTAAAVSNIIRIGGNNNNNTSSLLNGNLCEWVVGTEAWGDALIAQVVAYLNSKWAVY